MTLLRLSKKATNNWATTYKETLDDKYPMPTGEFVDLCERLRITDSLMASELFGVSWRTCQRYHYGEQGIPPLLARLLRIAVRLKMTPDDLRQLAAPISPR